MIRLVNYAFVVEAPLTAGRHTIRVVNEGPDGHDMALARLESGKTVDDIWTWLRGGEGPSPVRLAGGVAVLAPGMEAFFETDLTRGDYVLICFATARDGRTHLEHGMLQQVSVR